jgi:hypothetical protein
MSTHSRDAMRIAVLGAGKVGRTLGGSGWTPGTTLSPAFADPASRAQPQSPTWVYVRLD